MVEYLRRHSLLLQLRALQPQKQIAPEYEILITTYNLDEENKGESKFIILFHFPVYDCTI